MEEYVLQFKDGRYYAENSAEKVINIKDAKKFDADMADKKSYLLWRFGEYTEVIKIS